MDFYSILIICGFVTLSGVHIFHQQSTFSYLKKNQHFPKKLYSLFQLFRDLVQKHVLSTFQSFLLENVSFYPLFSEVF